MRDERRLPVLLGVGQVRGNRERNVGDAREPADLVLDALAAAAVDAGARTVLADADSIDTVKVASWQYRDLAGLLGERLGARPGHRYDSPIGGHWPAELLDRAAARIAAGESRVALLAGGEAQASMAALGRAGVEPAADLGWSADPGGPPVFDRDLLGSAAMQAAGLILPTRVYPLFENRLRFALGQSPGEANEISARMYAAFSRVAAANPVAWHPEARTAAEIGTVSASNRMVCEPYPLAMNAMPHVDQAAALIVTSLAVAREYGVPEDRLVHIWGGAGAVDSADVLRRPDFARSAALESAVDRTLKVAGVTASDVDVVDVYSCFPVVPKLVARHLGLAPDAVTGVTGGHSSFGGPLNSYTLHAVVAATRELRAGAQRALVHANGGHLTHQHAVLLGSEPHDGGYAGEPDPVDTAGPAPPSRPAFDGVVTVETATVEHGRDGSPAQGFVVGRTADGHRVAGQTAPGDAASASALSLQGGEIVGRTVLLSTADGYLRVGGER